ncbi:MAG: UDP-N-acetylglucosamine 4,6-dehydratase (inverting) [Xanthobacteraceae bacterium]|nr:UDP-N-acetylglucosamine 4,6-dehydratase (inverting) [Xanthobacteraceae bacterium]
MTGFYSPFPDLNGASILVTGATGSFGKAFVGRVLEKFEPRRLVIFSRDELKQYEMAQVFSHPSLRYFIGDVRDQSRLDMAFHGIDTVIHAAALKHVPIAEYNPFECVQTNIIGTENVVRAALTCGVRRVITLSTDKAVSPINLYGATKLAADKITIAANHLSGGRPTRFSVVRYGNVSASRGSVLPFFKQLAANGAKELPITDPRMTRFWITLPEAVDFVLSSLVLMEGGEIFVPKIPSLRVVDLAKAVAPQLPHKTVGIRPGEKLHEAMVTVDDAPHTFDLGDRYVIEPSFATAERKSFRDRGGKAVPEGFSYTSERNDSWLGAAELTALASSTVITA